jgi:epoxyqueuosine reductase QueG
MILSKDLKTMLRFNGADLVGFADLRELSEDVRDGLPFGISIGVALNPQIVSNIASGPTREYNDEYERANRLLDSLGRLTADLLVANGHKVKFAAATDNLSIINPETLSTPLPHKTVATLAGIGWVGKCALLVTENFGSAIQITSVLTDAELPTGDPINSSSCGKCIECVTVCLGQAPSGTNWMAGMSRDSFFDAFACWSNARAMTLERLGIHKSICGMCISVCPWTQKYVRGQRL